MQRHICSKNTSYLREQFEQNIERRNAYQARKFYERLKRQTVSLKHYKRILKFGGITLAEAILRKLKPKFSTWLCLTFKRLKNNKAPGTDNSPAGSQELSNCVHFLWCRKFIPNKWNLNPSLTRLLHYYKPQEKTLEK